MNNFRIFITSVFAVAAMLLAPQIAIGQVVGLAGSNDKTTVKVPPAYGVWTTVEGDKPEERIEVMRLKVYPQAAPVPALRYRLVPDPAERTEGNAAPAYLKAMGFVEQTNARIALSKQQRKWYDEATTEQQADGDYPPENWRQMSPDKLPLKEVESYLQLIRFQEPMLYDAARRKNYSQDRAMEREPNPVGYLLPEVQQMRELARHQILRLRYAIAQNRIDDAVEIVGQMLAMANHIGQDEFMVSTLVGVAIQGMATTEGLALSQQSTAPNLYWAIAACPKPLIDVSNSLETERQFSVRQFPLLKEVDETVRSKEYWADFARRFVPLWNEYASTMNDWNQGESLPSNVDSFQLASKIAAQYEPARRFLSEACGISNVQLDAYPATQIVFLAMVKYHAIVMDEATISFYLPFSTQQKFPKLPVRKKWNSELGWMATSLEMVTLVASEQIVNAIARMKQWMALWKTVEALRMTAFANGGQPPTSLDDFIVPVPLDPITDKPFEYSIEGQTVTITGALIDRARYRLRIEIATQNKETN